MDYIDGKLIVDELIIDPSLPNHIVVRIGADFYMLSNNRTGKVEEKDLRSYKKKVDKSWYRPTGNHHFWIHGLIPRGGYLVEVGRAITEREFSEVVEKYGLTEDDISDEFTDTRGGLYGAGAEKTFTAKQIRVSSAGEAMSLESELRDKGIQAASGSPGRVNIRVEQLVKQ